MNAQVLGWNIHSSDGRTMADGGIASVAPLPRNDGGEDSQ